MASAPLEFDPFDRAMRADPYPHYAALRSQSPVHQTRNGVWVLARYDDVNALLRDPRTSSDYGKAQGYEPDPVKELMRNVMLFADPPDHTRLRTLVNKAFTPRAVEALRPRIRGHVDDLLSAADGSIDVVSALTYPLTIRLMCDILGVPSGEHETFTALSRRAEEWWTGQREARMASILDPARQVADDTEDTQDAVWEFVTYVDALIKRRRAEPGDDLLSALIQAEERQDKLTEEELLFMTILLFVGGRDTTTNFVGNAILALLRHPAELARLRAEPGLVRSAVEELLRYDSAVQFTLRTVLSDVQVDGATIPAGQQVVLLLASANRDPVRFADPDRLDLARRDNQHLAFAGGGHFCVAAPLARAVGYETLDALVPRLPDSQPAVEPEWRDILTMKGPSSLSVVLR